MYYTKQAGFRSCITDISIEGVGLCQRLQAKLLFPQSTFSVPDTEAVLA